MIFKKLDTTNVSEIALLHYNSFENFFLTSLGKSFLLQFYKAILSHPNGLGIGVYNETELLGFAVGSQNNSAFYKALLRKNGIKMLWAALPVLLISPAKLKRLAVSFKSSSNKKHTGLPVLLSICIAPGSKSKGIGSRLISEFEAELIKNNLSELILTTDKYNNDYTNSFYLRNNYHLTDSFFQGKREMNLYYKKIKE